MKRGSSQFDWTLAHMHNPRERQKKKQNQKLNPKKLFANLENRSLAEESAHRHAVVLHRRFSRVGKDNSTELQTWPQGRRLPPAEFYGKDDIFGHNREKITTGPYRSAIFCCWFPQDYTIETFVPYYTANSPILMKNTTLLSTHILKHPKGSVVFILKHRFPFLKTKCSSPLSPGRSVPFPHYGHSRRLRPLLQLFPQAEGQPWLHHSASHFSRAGTAPVQRIWQQPALGRQRTTILWRSMGWEVWEKYGVCLRIHFHCAKNQVKNVKEP